MKRWAVLLIVHIVLLVLASTAFTVVTGMKDGRFGWQYFMYHWQTGWGLRYQFPYSLPVVLTYVAAYGVGLAAYVVALVKGSRIIAGIGIALCLLGLVSFLFELTHWFSDRYDSWVFSAPGALLLLAILAAVQLYRARRESKNPHLTSP